MPRLRFGRQGAGHSRALAHDYNRVRPHSALADRTPSEVLDMWVDSRMARESTEERKDRIDTEIAGRFATISLCYSSGVSQQRDSQPTDGAPQEAGQPDSQVPEVLPTSDRTSNGRLLHAILAEQVRGARLGSGHPADRIPAARAPGPERFQVTRVFAHFGRWTFAGRHSRMLT